MYLRDEDTERRIQCFIDSVSSYNYGFHLQKEFDNKVLHARGFKAVQTLNVGDGIIVTISGTMEMIPKRIKDQTKD